MPGVGAPAQLACTRNDVEGHYADLTVLILRAECDLPWAAGSGQTRRIDDIRVVFASPSINRSESADRSEPDFPPPQTSG